MNELLPLIKDVGFPVFAFLIMVWMNVKTIDKNTDAINHLIEYLRNGRSK